MGFIKGDTRSLDSSSYQALMGSIFTLKFPYPNPAASLKATLSENPIVHLREAMLRWIMELPTAFLVPLLDVWVRYAEGSLTLVRYGICNPKP